MNAKDLASTIKGYLKKSDVSSPVIYTISKASLREVGQGADREEKPVLDFLETNKSLVLNNSRAAQLAGIFGDKDLVGQKIKLEVRDEAINGKDFNMICIDPV